MTAVFDQLCIGPMAIIDDKVKEEPVVRSLECQLKKRSVPVVTCETIEEANELICGLTGCSIVILDWLFNDIEEKDKIMDVSLGSTAKSIKKEEVIQFIKNFLGRCTVPICILSAESEETIYRDLSAEGIPVDDSCPLFIVHKDSASEEKGAVIDKIDAWIKQHPHVYLTLWWKKQCRASSDKLFVELFRDDPFWPHHFVERFALDGVDQGLAILETVNQLVQTGMGVDDLDVSLCEATQEPNLDTLKKLYRRLHYTKENIDKDILPGDVFKKAGSYYLNIRPDCDTTTRVDDDHQIYLIKGDAKKPDKMKSNYRDGRLMPEEKEIILHLLDGKDIVVFNKRLLKVEKYSEWKEKKICRVVQPYITQIRHSFCTHLGRYGVPSAPDDIVRSMFESEKKRKK